MNFDNAINATLLLLVLSLITEKIANYIKLSITRLAIPQASVFFETSRTKSIQKRTIVIGVIVAILCKANLFIIFDPSKPLFWTKAELDITAANFDWLLFAATLFGSLLTGLFLSFGSKFFHDLLDLLLQAKNLKRKLVDRADWSFDTIEEVDTYILTNDSADAKAKIREQLSKFEGIEYYRVDYSQKLVYVFARDKDKIATQINVPGSLSMATFKVVLLKDTVAEVVALGAMKPTLQLANAMPYQNKLFGTSGLMVQDTESDQKYVLTCYHAVWNKPMKWSGFAQLPECKVNSPLGGTLIGNLYIGIKNYKLDVALIKPGEGITLSNQMPLNKMPKGVRTLTDNDVKSGTRLCMISMQAPDKYRFGVCANINCTANITYPDGIKRDLQKLYQIESLQKEPFSVEGDSGSLILDEFDYAVGLLVAGDKATTSFAMPLDSILKAYNLKLFI